MRIYGVDFTSAPTATKPITVAVGTPRDGRLSISSIETLPTFTAFEQFLERPGPWIGGFDFPFGISREAVTDLAWPNRWTDLLLHCKALGRKEFKRVLDAYRKTRAKGNRYAKRRGDTAAGAHPSVKLVNPPVGFMFLEGATRLAAADLHIPGLRPSNSSKVALEAYPGLLVVRHLGIRASYKSDEVRKQTPARRQVREQIVSHLKSGRPAGIHVQLENRLASILIDDGKGDSLDAVICAVQAYWGLLRSAPNYGLPMQLDPLEGWIVSAEAPPTY